MYVCYFITSERVIGQKNGLHHWICYGSGMVLKLTRSSQRPVCSSDYEKTLLKGILLNTFTNSNPLFLTILICTQINHVVYVYLGINDTKTKQISNFVNKSFISITNVFKL